MPIPDSSIAGYIHTGPWWRNRGILMLNLCLLLPMLSGIVTGLDTSLVNGLQILPEWQDYFHYPSGKSLGLIGAAQVIGAFVSTPLTAMVCDRFGRKKATILGSTIMIGGVALQVASKNVSMLIGSRVIGFGLSFAFNATPLLILELAYPTQRGKFTSMFNALWYVGSTVAAWICYGTYRSAPNSIWSWRIPCLTQCLIPLLQIGLLWFIPESPRWLVAHGREGEASRILARYHANNGDEREPLVVFEMAQIRHALRMEKEMNEHTSWLTLVATPGNRKRMLIVVALAVFSQWSGNGLVSYYIHLILANVGITSPSTQAAINGGLQLFNLVIAIFGSSLIDRLGRRPLFIISNLGMLIVFCIWTLTTALFNTLENEASRQASAKATIPFIFMFYFFYDLAYTPILIAYVIEILPFNIRAKGFAVMGGTLALVLAFNQFVNPWALNAIGWKYYLVYCGWLAFEFAFVLKFIIETKGRTLEETAALFDGEEPPQALSQKAGEAAAGTMIATSDLGDLYDEVEEHLNHIGLDQKSSRHVEFHELKQTRSTITSSTIDRSGDYGPYYRSAAIEKKCSNIV